MPEPLNLLVIMPDDQGAWALGCAGAAELATPNLDRLAAEGTRFDNFFCASPVCSPARASWLTGQIPSVHGVHDWLRAGNIVNEDGARPAGQEAPVEYLAGLTGFTQLLAQAGWLCGHAGKWHMGDSARPQQGHTWWSAYATGGGHYYDWRGFDQSAEPTHHREYITDYYADRARSFLGQHGNGPQPWCLSLHFTAPHSPWDRRNHPAALWDKYHDLALASVPDEPAHPWFRNEFGQVPRQEKLAGYFAAIEAMDAAVGRVLERLEQMRLRERTLVAYVGDNGMNMGHHGIWGKGNGTWPLNMYDTSVKVPAIFCCPGRVPAGQVAGGLYSQLDWLPTVVDYFGLAPHADPRLPGRSFAPVLRGEPDAGRDDVVICDEYGPTRMLRTREWKYVQRYPDGPDELYDLVGDPGERVNRVADPAHAARVTEMRSRLGAWFAQYADPARDGWALPVTGLGQLARCEQGAAAFAPHRRPA